MSSTKTDSKRPLYLDELEVGVTGSLTVMLCRMWDVSAVTGRYLSTDFVICDAKGNLMHGTARSTVAHNFLKLKEGSIYSIKNFSVQPNKDDFRIFKDAPFIVEFDGETVVRKSFVESDGFIRYPFTLVELEDLELTHNKYMIDVVGFVTNVGRIVQQRSGSKTLDFQLTNSRGHAVRVTMWGILGEKLIEKRTRRKGLYPVVLTAMSVKTYNNKLYLSSSSSTMIMDDAAIPMLKHLNPEQSDTESKHERLPVDFAEAKAGTLENLLMWGRNKKNDAATFNCVVRIDNVRRKMGWNFPSCGGEKCTKQSTRKDGSFWCDSCEIVVDYPVMRYRLELEVSDATAQVVVVMFNEVATKLVKQSADSVLEATYEDGDEESPLPTPLANIISTTVTLELKTSSYYEHATYESFTCWTIISPEEVGETGDSTTLEPAGQGHSALVIKSLKHPSIATPSKPAEAKKHKRVDIEDSDTEGSFVAGGEIGHILPCYNF